MSIKWAEEKSRMRQMVQEDLFTLEEIGEVYEVSRERIRQVIRVKYGWNIDLCRGNERAMKRILRDNPRAMKKDYWLSLRYSKEYTWMSMQEMSVRSGVSLFHMRILFKEFGIPTSLTFEEKLLLQVKKMPSGCWEWQGIKYPAGYGHIGPSTGGGYAHRAAWILKNGPIPKNGWVCHTCDNPPCINPHHLYLGDAKSNANDRERRGRGNRNVQR